jgi:hypothetical protein
MVEEKNSPSNNTPTDTPSKDISSPTPPPKPTSDFVDVLSESLRPSAGETRSK